MIKYAKSEKYYDILCIKKYQTLSFLDDAIEILNWTTYGTLLKILRYLLF